MKKLILLILVFANVCALMAQNRRHDSLLHVLKTSQVDSVKLHTYIELGDLFRKTDYDSALYYYQAGLNHSKSVGYDLGVGRALFSISCIISYQGAYLVSIDTLEVVLKIYQHAGYSKGISHVYNSLGVNFYNLSNYDTARYYYSASLSMNTKMQDSIAMATSYTNLGVVDYVQSNYDDALEHFIKAMEIRDKIGSNFSRASIYMKIALIYNHLNNPSNSYDYLVKAVDLYNKEGALLDKAKAMINLSNTYYTMDSIEMYKKTLFEANRIVQKVGNKRTLATVNVAIGHVFMRENNLDSALVHFYKALDIIKALNQQRELSNLYVNIGEVFFKLADYDAAIEYFNSSLGIMKKIKVYDDKAYLLEMLASSYDKKKDYKNAYLFSKKYAQFKDSILNDEKHSNLERIEAKFKKRQQEQRIALLENQQRLNELKLQKVQSARNFVIIIALLSVVLIIVLFQRYRQKVTINKVLQEKNREVQQKNKEIQTQANNMEDFNKLLVEQNQFIETQKLKLENANRTKDRFFSIIGHDLRSPIAAVFSTIGLFRLKSYSPEKQSKLLCSVEENLQTTLDLLENLMLWAKNQEKNIHPNFQLVAIDELVHKAIKSVDSMLRNKQLEVVYDTADRLMVNVDVNMMATIMRNLLSNAAKFSHVNGIIRVSVVQQSETIKVQVQDKGIGMSQEVLNKITNKNSYFTIEGTKNERGSGLGLNLCKDFVEMHSGVFMIESEQGKGSTFSFTIPTTKNS